MNAQAMKIAAKRTGKFNLWALVTILLFALVLAVKGQTATDLPARHFAPPAYETAR